MNMDIKKITADETSRLLDSNEINPCGQYQPFGLFWLKSTSGLYIAIDNSTGCAWTEEFKTRDSCMKYLRGEPSTDAHKVRHY